MLITFSIACIMLCGFGSLRKILELCIGLNIDVKCSTWNIFFKHKKCIL